jgi:hypothetical protein
MDRLDSQIAEAQTRERKERELARHAAIATFSRPSDMRTKRGA